jgi:hypothetical protein
MERLRLFDKIGKGGDIQARNTGFHARGLHQRFFLFARDDSSIHIMNCTPDASLVANIDYPPTYLLSQRPGKIACSSSSVIANGQFARAQLTNNFPADQPTDPSGGAYHQDM